MLLLLLGAAVHMCSVFCSPPPSMDVGCFAKSELEVWHGHTHHTFAVVARSSYTIFAVSSLKTENYPVLDL